MAEKDWIESQKKVFRGWMNMYLNKRGMEVPDLSTAPGIRDGVALYVLMEELSGKQLPFKVLHNPSMRMHKLQNLSVTFKFIFEQGVKLVACGPEDICDGNLKLTLGLIWTLIQKFQIQSRIDAVIRAREEEEAAQPEGPRRGAVTLKRQAGAKKMLLDWTNDQLADSGVEVKNLASDWKDGTLILRLIHKVRPDVVDLSQMGGRSAHENLVLAFDLAHDHLDIPKLLDPDYIANSPSVDEQSMMTYLGLFPSVLADLPRARRASAPKEVVVAAPAPVAAAPPPAPVVVEMPVPSAALTIVSGDGAHGGTSGVQATFAVHPVDKNRKLIENAADYFEAYLEPVGAGAGDKSSRIPITLQNGEGDHAHTVKASYLINTPGEHRLYVALKPEYRTAEEPEGLVAGMPAKVVIENPEELLPKAVAQRKHQEHNAVELQDGPVDAGEGQHAPDEASRDRHHKKRTKHKKYDAQQKVTKAATMLVPLEQGSRMKVFSLKVIRTIQ